MFELIVACTPSGVIGDNNDIPWYIPEDLKHFRKITDGHVVVMGRKTFESLPNQKPLKNRYNIVLTSQIEDKKDTYENLMFTNYTNLLPIIEEKRPLWGNKVFVIGGNSIYKVLFPLCDKLHITIVNDDDFKGDIVFPYNINTIEDDFEYEKTHISEQFLSRNENIPYQFVEFTKT